MYLTGPWSEGGSYVCWEKELVPLPHMPWLRIVSPQQVAPIWCHWQMHGKKGQAKLRWKDKLKKGTKGKSLREDHVRDRKNSKN